MRTARRAATAALACTTALVLAGCSLLGQDEPARDDAGEITEATDAGAFTLRVGDCLEAVDWSSAEAATFPVIPCAEEHESEIYASLQLDDGDFPGDAAVEAAAIDFCDAEFADFVGVAWDASTLAYAFLVPTEQTWADADDREVLCLVIDPAGLVAGSLEGAAR